MGSETLPSSKTLESRNVGLGTILETKQEEQSIVRKTWVISMKDVHGTFNPSVLVQFQDDPPMVPSPNGMAKDC